MVAFQVLLVLAQIFECSHSISQQERELKRKENITLIISGYIQSLYNRDASCLVSVIKIDR